MKQQLLEKYSVILDRAEKYNAQNKTKRFWPLIAQNKYGGSPSTIGLYDYQLKKYVLVETLSHELERSVEEMQTMIDGASPKQKKGA